MKPLVILKNMSVLFLLICMARPLLAQTNQFRDDKLLGEKERQQRKRNKIKEVKIYLFHYRDSLLGADSLLVANNSYDQKGYLKEHINYRLSEYGNKVPTLAAHFVDLYDDAGNIIQHAYFVQRYAVFNNKLMGPSMEDVQAVTYQYDEHHVLIKDIDHLDNFIEGALGRERLGTGVTDYSYDARGNLAMKISHNLDGKFTYRNEYAYDRRNQLLAILTYIDSVAEKPYVRQEYQYTYSRNGLTKLESIYNKNNWLSAQREFVYDKRGNQVKGYEIVNGVRRLVWDYAYDQNNRLTASFGGPASRFGPGYKAYGYHYISQVKEAPGPADPFGPYSMELRSDGLAHLFYTYNENGELMEIKKYDTGANGENTLTAAEKFYYTRY